MVNSTRKSGTPRNSHNMVKENDYKGEERERERVLGYYESIQNWHDRLSCDFGCWKQRNQPTMFAFVCVCLWNKSMWVSRKREREREILSVIFVLYFYVVLKFRRVLESQPINAAILSGLFCLLRIFMCKFDQLKSKSMGKWWGQPTLVSRFSRMKKFYCNFQ